MGATWLCRMGPRQTQMKKENLYTPNCIRTFTGIYLNILEPTPDMIEIKDIAHALSNQPRFAGHLPMFYSVAQHSVVCSQLVNDDQQKLCALLHDASEAYLLDIPRPVKKVLTNYKEIENKLMEVIAKKFNIAWPLPDSVKKIDEEILQFEWDHLMLGKPQPGNEPFWCWHNLHAEEKFMEEFYYLTKVYERRANT